MSDDIDTIGSRARANPGGLEFLDMIEAIFRKYPDASYKAAADYLKTETSTVEAAAIHLMRQGELKDFADFRGYRR